MSELIDAETVAALKVLRGDRKKDPTAVDKDFASGLAKQIVDALSSQKEASSSQTAELIAAVREQTAVLQKLTGLLETKQKTTVVVVNNQEKRAIASSVASTAAETELSTITDEASIAAAVAAAEQAMESEAASSTTTEPVSQPVSQPVSPAPVTTVSRGPWAFVESEDATKLLGTISGSDLVGDSFGDNWERMRERVDQYGKLQAPKWSVQSKKSVRSCLPRLAIGGKTKIELNTGKYYLTIQYQNPSETPVEAAIVIGEIAFDNRGYVLAPGAKWKKILKGETQTEPRMASSKPKWYASPVSEGWKNGDILRFKIDTDTNTVVYTLSSPGADEAKAGWKFENVLTFTSLPTYPNDLRAFAYCGGKGKNLSAAKLTLVDATAPTDSCSTITEEEAKE